MAARRTSTSNPLALAVLACLHERPMHPYEMASTMRERGKEQSIKLNYGSLYTVVDSLAKHGLIEAMEARREGRRPERTVYQLTDSRPGQARRVDVRTAGRRRSRSTRSSRPPCRCCRCSTPTMCSPCCGTRIRALEKEIATARVMLGTASQAGLPRLLLIESEYHLALRETELSWVRNLADEHRGRDAGGPGRLAARLRDRRVPHWDRGCRGAGRAA